MSRLSKAEQAAAAARDVTLAGLLAQAGPWDVERVQQVILTWARQHGEVSANDIRQALTEKQRDLVGPAFNRLAHSRVLQPTGELRPSVGTRAKGHPIRVYRLRPEQEVAA